jgi:hypothetical protein
MHDIGLRAASAAVMVVAAAQPARAGDDYIEQIVVADAASVALVVGMRDTPAVGLASYALLSPAVHLAHGQGDRAIVSLAMRALPVLSIATLERCEGGESALGCGLVHVYVGFLGGLAASAVDAFVVADGDPPIVSAPLYRGSF